MSTYEDDTMARAKKLKSGSWRCLAYSHTEQVWDPKKKDWKEKRFYESFTAPTRKEAGLLAATVDMFNPDLHIKSSSRKRRLLSSTYPLTVTSKLF